MTALIDSPWQIKDALMKRGFEGGIEAAKDLRRQVMEGLRQKAIDLARDLGIIIFVYAGVLEMAAKYLETDAPKSTDLLKVQKWAREFRHGFNSAHPWSCFDDMKVSPGKRYELRGE